MRNFDYSAFPGALLTPEICNLLSAIHEYRGKLDLYITAQKDILKTLLEVAIIQSTDASNRIEGIFTSDARLKELVMKNHNRSTAMKKLRYEPVLYRFSET